ncbi:MAG TPA: thioesterase family protein [Candidatus Polarisedimenticolia bacterium]|nr:thioesterase family protein [Candidatus Polarisedimenticolia bacterium]
MSYATRVKVRFGDIDHAGIAYYPNLYHYLHIAFEEFFEEFIGTPYPDVLDREKLGFPTVKVETEFLEPIRYGDTLAITITIPRIGNSSVDILFTASRGAGGAPCIVSRHTVVAVSMTSMRPIPIPPAFRSHFERCVPAA